MTEPSVGKWVSRCSNSFPRGDRSIDAAVNIGRDANKRRRQRMSQQDCFGTVELSHNAICCHTISESCIRIWCLAGYSSIKSGFCTFSPSWESLLSIFYLVALWDRLEAQSHFLRVIVSAVPQSGMLIRTGKNCGSWKCDARLRRNVATFQCLEVVPFFQHLVASEAASSPCAGPERKKGCFQGWVIQSDSTDIWSFAFLRYIDYHNSNDKSFYYWYIPLKQEHPCKLLEITVLHPNFVARSGGPEWRRAFSWCGGSHDVHCFGVAPPNSDHQDYSIFTMGFL